MEDGIGQKLPTDAVILQWLVRWAAMLYSRFKRGEDGKTAYERQRGCKCIQEVVPFGEKVHYRKLEGENKNKLESQWEAGIWLGHARGSNEILIGTDQGVVRAWAVKRMPAEERWSAADVLGLRGVPARPNPQAPGQDVPVAIYLPDSDAGVAPEEVRPPRVETGPRRTYLKAKHFKMYGYTDGCEGCRRIRTGGMGVRPHTEECRERMEKKLEEMEDPLWRRAKDRMNEAVWEEVQRQEASRSAAGVKRQGPEERGEDQHDQESDVKKQREEATGDAVESDIPKEDAGSTPPAGDTVEGGAASNNRASEPEPPEAVGDAIMTSEKQGTKRGGGGR